MSGCKGGKRKPLKQPKKRPRRWTRKTRLSSRNKKRREETEELKAQATGKGPMATGGIKKSGEKQAVPHI